MGRNRTVGSDRRHSHLPELLSRERRREVCGAKTGSGDTNVGQRGSPRDPIVVPFPSGSAKLRNLSPGLRSRKRKLVVASAPIRRDCSRPGKVAKQWWNGSQGTT